MFGEGVITNIFNDFGLNNGGELGVHAKDFDTDLNYTGAITFNTIQWRLFYRH